MTANSGPKMRLFVEACLKSLSHVFSQALMSPWQVTAANAASAPSEQAAVLCFALSKGLRGKIAFAIDSTAGVTLARLFMGIPPEEAKWDDDAQQAVEELFRQVAGRLATEVSSVAGEVQIEFVPRGPDARWQPASRACLRAATEGSVLEIELLFNAEATDCLEQAVEQSNVEDLAAQTSGSISRENINLLMDVELKALLRFGQRRMLLRDVLELSAGAVIELDRQVQDPVELLLDGRIVARGEVVIVDGNYGLRVTDVASAPQRANLIS